MGVVINRKSTSFFIFISKSKFSVKGRNFGRVYVKFRVKIIQLGFLHKHIYTFTYINPVFIYVYVCVYTVGYGTVDELIINN